jgi:RNA polymerase sigma-70 factor (ECF subfamily)
MSTTLVGQARLVIGSVPLSRRRTCDAAYFSELTYVEVAQRLNQPLGTIKTRIRSALGKCCRALSPGVHTR